MDSYFHIFTDTIFGFFALFLLTKLLGKTQISQLTAFDFISAVILGELVGNALFDKDTGIAKMAFVIALWGVLLYSVEMVVQKFKGSRFILEGKPSLVIHKGAIIREEMKKNKIDVSELQHLLRAKDVFSIQEVEYAILETNGHVSVMKKPEYQTPNKKDLNVYPEEAFLPFTLISDGEIIEDNVKEAGLSKDWLHKEIKKQNYNNVEDVFYAEYTEGKKLFLSPFRNKPERVKD
ncbi:DUF421 domain-containing protein [Virgibacillus sp. MSJ-26]|uniref:DUF421 domain-containing protein n=1 Tax=Virgibacillus sp. MSJ-26 TaxID=2841522 RepID=UPI001C0FAD67|nr:DUF421 domain-containing protein [Virgibacillus sp. MSJ-26]MBU5468504.1 DUF421 domain-containing protein [Virgibacillus sp. MSJ-26]